EVAHVTVDRGAALMDAEAAVLMLATESGEMKVSATYGIPDLTVQSFREPATGEMIDRLQGLLKTSDERFVAVPLVVAGAVTGLIAVALRHARWEADEWMLSALADQ